MKKVTGCLLAALCAGCALLSCAEQKMCMPAEASEMTFRDAPADYLIASNFRNIHMVQLEMKDECVVSDVKRIIDTDGKVFVLTSDNEIFCFDRSTGKYLSTIGSVGEGPGEYVDATDIFYDEREKRICVLDCTKNAIHAYTLDGKYNGDRTPGQGGDAIAALSWAICAERSADGSLMIASQMTGGYPSNDYAYTVVRPDGTLSSMDAFAPVKVEDYAMPFATRSIAVCEDGLRFFKFLNDTIFTLKDGEAVPYCRLNTGRSMPPKDVVAKMGSYKETNLYNLYKSSGYAMTFREMYECGNLIAIVPELYMMTGGYFWIDKERQEGIHILATGDFGDECFRFLQGQSIIRLVGSNGKELISAFSGATSIRAVQKQLSDGKTLKLYDKRMKTFFEKADPEGNPCLVFYEN